MSDAITSDAPPKRKRSGAHRCRLFPWRPGEELRERLAAYAAAKELPAATALTDLVALALERAEFDEGLSGTATTEVFESIQVLSDRAAELGRRLEALALLTDQLGPVALSIPRILAYWIAHDPSSWRMGETEEQAEERVLDEIDAAALGAWEVVRFPDLEIEAGAPAPADARAQDLLRDIAGALATRRRPSQATPAADQRPLAASQRRRVDAWARREGLDSTVALQALLELALQLAEGKAAVPAWALSEVRGRLDAARDQLRRIEWLADAIRHRLDATGSFVVSVPQLLIRWLAADPRLGRDDQLAPLATLEQQLAEQWAEDATEAWDALTRHAWEDLDVLEGERLQDDDEDDEGGAPDARR